MYFNYIFFWSVSLKRPVGQSFEFFFYKENLINFYRLGSNSRFLQILMIIIKFLVQI